MQIDSKELKYLATVAGKIKKNLFNKKSYTDIHLFIAPHKDKQYLGLVEGRYAIFKEIGKAEENSSIFLFDVNPAICNLYKGSLNIKTDNNKLYIENICIEPVCMYTKDMPESKSFCLLNLLDSIKPNTMPESYFAFNPDYLQIGNKWLDGIMSKHPFPDVEKPNGDSTLACWHNFDNTKYFFCMSFYRKK